ncbi:MAG: hypothetical protein GWN58_22090, partial [Anaerolineae bacterium]|nr:hypothetical protein [Anaerolineae bacterium]
MTDWVEKYHQHKQTAQKGGPGSGHHGHAGRPGQRGGSLPGKASGAPRSGTAPASVELKADRRAAEFLAQGLPEKNSLGNIIRDKEGNPRWSGESRPRIKAEVVDALAQKAGLSKEQVNDIVGEWSETSSDESRKALEMQVAAARVFGTEASFRLKQTFGT